MVVLNAGIFPKDILVVDRSLKAENGVVKKNKNLLQHPDFERHDEIGWNYRLPEINSCIAYAQLERVDDILGSDVRVMEEFATGKKIKIPTRGESKVGQAEVAAENAADAAAEREAMTLVRQEPEDFASGGLAKLLGE